jgi:hypothetical protein
MANITRRGVVIREMKYKDDVISWDEPQMLGDRFRGSVNGGKAIDGRDRADMIAKAKKYIDD